MPHFNETHRFMIHPEMELRYNTFTTYIKIGSAFSQIVQYSLNLSEKSSISYDQLISTISFNTKNSQALNNLKNCQLVKVLVNNLESYPSQIFPAILYLHDDCNLVERMNSQQSNLAREIENYVSRNITETYRNFYAYFNCIVAFTPVPRTNGKNQSH